MSTNVSLANPGMSLDFDAQALQAQEEAEREREDQEQQQELRRVIQEFGEQDDLLSEASSDGDSVNLSLLSGQDRSYNQISAFEPVHQVVSSESQRSIFHQTSNSSPTVIYTPRSDHTARSVGQTTSHQTHSSASDQSIKLLGHDASPKTGQEYYWDSGDHLQLGSSLPENFTHYWNTPAEDKAGRKNLQPDHNKPGDIPNKLLSSESDGQLAHHLEKCAAHAGQLQASSYANNNHYLHIDEGNQAAQWIGENAGPMKNNLSNVPIEWSGASCNRFSKDDSDSPIQFWESSSEDRIKPLDISFGHYDGKEKQRSITLAKAMPSAQAQNRNSALEKDFSDDYRVMYKNPNIQTSTSAKLAELGRREKFMEPAGESEEAQQLSQLRILYESRGRRLEDLTAELEAFRQESSKERRMLKHHLSLAQGEKEGLAKSLKECQQLLQDTKDEQVKTLGKLRAVELQVQVLKEEKDEVTRRQQSAETTIENLTHQLAELHESESLLNARKQHESIVASMQQRYNVELHTLKEKLDAATETVSEKNKEIEKLWQQIGEQRKQFEELQISRADIINQLTRRLEESQRQCQSLLETTSSQEIGRLKAQLQQTLASKRMSEDMISSLQAEVKELKQELSMLESASSLGVISHQGKLFADDSMTDLGIRKTLDFSSPVSAGKFDGSQPREELITNLRRELERCLGNNKQKRTAVAELQKEKQALEEKLLHLQEELTGAQTSIQEMQVKLKSFEDLYGGDHQESAVVSRLKKDIENLQQEKKALMQEVDDYKMRVNEVAASEARLTEINQQLNFHMSQMVRQHDLDKTEALERCKRTCEDIHRSSRELMERDLSSKFFADKQELLMKYERQLEILRETAEGAQEELVKVKEMYSQACQDLAQLEEKLHGEYNSRLKNDVAELRKQLEEENLALRKAEEQEIAERVQLQLKLELEEKYRKEQLSETEKQIAQARAEWQQHQEAVVQEAVAAAERQWTEKMEKLSEEMEHKIEAERIQWETDQQLQVEVQLKQHLEREYLSWKIKADKETLKQVDAAVGDAQQKISELQAELAASRREHAAELKNLEDKIQQEVAQRQADLERHLKAQSAMVTDIEMNQKLAEKEADLLEEFEKRLQDQLEKLRESKAEELKQCLKDQEEQLSREWQKKFEIEINQAVSNAVATCEASNIEKNKKQTEAATQEVIKWKMQFGELQAQLKMQVQKWQDERVQLLQEKDEERRQAVVSVRQQCQNDYQRFISDSKVTLSAALTSARQEHEQELEKLAARHQEEIAALRESEHELQKIVATWNKSDSPTQHRTKHQLMQRAEKLQQEVEKREKLLQQADAHMQQEVEKLRESMAHSYAKQRESDRLRLQHQLTQYSQAMQQGQRERTHLERQMETMVEEFRKEKDLLEQQLQQISKELKVKSQTVVKLQSYEEDYHAQVQQLQDMEGEKQVLRNQLEERESDIDLLSQEKNKLQQVLSEMEAVQKEECSKMSEKLQACQAALMSLKEEKESLIERLSTTQQKHEVELGKSHKRLGEVRERLHKMEVALAAVNKQHVEDMEKVHLRLRTAHQQVDELTQQLAQTQKEYKTALEEVEKQHQKEKKEMAACFQQQIELSLADTYTQTDTDDSLSRLKDEYINTMKKIKGEIKSHISQSNLRAAVTLRTCLRQQRLLTIRHLRQCCKSRLQLLLTTCVDGSAGENLWITVEQNLDCLFDSVSSAFSLTPSASTTTTPRSIEKKDQSLDEDKIIDGHQLVRTKISTHKASCSSGKGFHTPLSTPRSVESEHLALPSHLSRVELFDQGHPDASISELQGSGIFFPLVSEETSSLTDLHSDSDMESKLQPVKPCFVTVSSKNNDKNTDQDKIRSQFSCAKSENVHPKIIKSSDVGSLSLWTSNLHKGRGEEKSEGLEKGDNAGEWREIGIQSWSEAEAMPNLWQAFTDVADLRLETEKNPRKQLYFDTETDLNSNVGIGRGVLSPKMTVSPARDLNPQSNGVSEQRSALLSKSGDFTKHMKKFSVRYKSLDNLLVSPERDEVPHSTLPERDLQWTLTGSMCHNTVDHLQLSKTEVPRTGTACTKYSSQGQSNYRTAASQPSQGKKSLNSVAARHEFGKKVPAVNESCTSVSSKRISDSFLLDHTPRTVHSIEKLMNGMEQDNAEHTSKQRTRSAESLAHKKILCSSPIRDAQSVRLWQGPRLSFPSEAQVDTSTKACTTEQIIRGLQQKLNPELIHQSSETEKHVEKAYAPLSHLGKAKWHSEQVLNALKCEQRDDDGSEDVYQYTPLKHFLAPSSSTSLLSTYSASEGDLRFLPYEISAKFTEQF